MAPPEDDPPAGAPEWVVTFGDMMSLLMVFFVLLLSFSTTEIEKFKQVAGFVKEAFGVQKKRSWNNVPSGETMISTNQKPTSGESKEDKEDASKEVIFEKVMETVKRSKHAAKLEASIAENGVIVRAEGAALFDSASAKLREEALEIVDEIGRLANSTGVKVEVEGHTDSRPISTAAFPSNWELSSARAGAVVRRLTGGSSKVPTDRVRPIGYADTRSVADNSTPEGRAKNRRVEFLFLHEDQE